MKVAIGTMIGFFFLSFLVLPVMFDHFFGPDEAGLFPVYSGMILLSGLIVVCTKIVIEEIRELKEKQSGKNVEE